jgi:hypothetical protein
MAGRVIRRNNHLTILAIIAATLVGTAAADAEADNDSAKKQEFVTRLFAGPVGKTKTFACFVRQYDAGHLRHHPLQRVSAMKLLVTAETVPEADGPTYSFRLGVRYRNKAGVYDSSGGCAASDISAETDNEARLHCGVDCDGGGIEIRLTKDFKATLIRLERIRIWRDNAPDEEASEALVAGADDKIFRLDRADLEECRSLVTDRKELAEMRRKR